MEQQKIWKFKLVGEDARRGIGNIDKGATGTIPFILQAG